MGTFSRPMMMLNWYNIALSPLCILYQRKGRFSSAPAQVDAINTINVYISVLSIVNSDITTDNNDNDI
jgi:hypothetical protein